MLSCYKMRLSCSPFYSQTHPFSLTYSLLSYTRAHASHTHTRTHTHCLPPSLSRTHSNMHGTQAFLIACTSDVIPQLVYAYNTNYVETCAQHDWPSCHVARIFKQEAGYLNTAVQQFSVKNMFDEERGFPVNQTSPPSDSPVPDVELYTLKAYYPNETKAEFLFMPYVDVECLSGLIGSTLGYKDLTESLAKNSTIRGYIPNCITDESITCG